MEKTSKDLKEARKPIILTSKGTEFQTKGAITTNVLPCLANSDTSREASVENESTR